MRAALDWLTPRTLAEALRVLADRPDAIPFAGGTDLMVQIHLGALARGTFVDVRRLAELRGIETRGEEVLIGALTTYREVAASPLLRARYAPLVQAARLSGAGAIQTRGTLGGNIANASPAADSPPALLAHGARVELTSARGARWLDYADFHLGYRRTARAADELLTRIALPPPAGVGFYRKVGTRAAQAISKVCLAGVARWEGGRLADARIALGSVAPTVILARRTADLLRGRRRAEIDVAAARAALDAEITPIDDVRSTVRYRRAVAGALLDQFLDETAPAPA